jgi:hypothetical protein
MQWPVNALQDFMLGGLRRSGSNGGRAKIAGGSQNASDGLSPEFRRRDGIDPSHWFVPPCAKRLDFYLKADVRR